MPVKQDDLMNKVRMGIEYEIVVKNIRSDVTGGSIDWNISLLNKLCQNVFNDSKIPVGAGLASAR